MQQPTFGEAVGAVMVLEAMGVISYLAVVTKNEITIGALISVVAGGVTYFIRGRLQPPTP